MSAWEERPVHGGTEGRTYKTRLSTGVDEDTATLEGAASGMKIPRKIMGTGLGESAIEPERNAARLLAATGFVP